MKKIRLGFIGCGVIGYTHLKAAQEAEGIEIAAIADLFKEKAQDRAKEFGVPDSAVYSDGAELIAKTPDLDGVIFATITSARSALAVEALKAGKHILVEKPVAMNVAEVEAMLAARGDLAAGCCSARQRFTKSAVAATKFYATGVLGDLRVVHCRAHGSATPAPAADAPPPPAWRLNKSLNGGGILSNWGCYDLDYLLGIAGWSLEPQTVLAQTWRVPPMLQSRVAENSDAETYASALIRCAGGTVISYERGELMPAPPTNAWQLVGTEGTLTLAMIQVGTKQIVHSTATAAEGHLSKVIWEGEDTHEEVMAGPVVDFAAAIREGRQPRTGLEQSLILQKITDGIYASAESGNAVTIG